MTIGQCATCKTENVRIEPVTGWCEPCELVAEAANYWMATSQITPDDTNTMTGEEGYFHTPLYAKVFMAMRKLRKAMEDHAELDYEGWAEASWLSRYEGGEPDPYEEAVAQAATEEEYREAYDKWLAYQRLHQVPDFSHFTPRGYCHPSYAHTCLNLLLDLIEVDKGQEIVCSEYLGQDHDYDIGYDYGPPPMTDDDVPF